MPGTREALAVRFAAKEATSKALGTGIRPDRLAGGGDPAQMERGTLSCLARARPSGSQKNLGWRSGR